MGREDHVAQSSHEALVDLVEQRDATAVWFDGCGVGHSTQKTTQIICSKNMVARVRVRFDHIRCSHTHDTNLLGRYVSGKYKSSSAEEYPPAQNRLLWDCFEGNAWARASEPEGETASPHQPEPVDDPVVTQGVPKTAEATRRQSPRLQAKRGAGMELPPAWLPPHME